MMSHLPSHHGKKMLNTIQDVILKDDLTTNMYVCTLLPSKFAPFIFRSFYIWLPLIFAPLESNLLLLIFADQILTNCKNSFRKIAFFQTSKWQKKKKNFRKINHFRVVTRPKIYCHLQTRYLTSYPKYW